MKRILFVDDDLILLESLRRALRPQRANWETVVADGGEAALRLMEARPFDAVVADMRMPGMDGAQFLERVRDRFPSVVRLILSGHDDSEASLRAVAVAHQFLRKPCDAVALLEAIERALGPGSAIEDRTVRRIVGAVGELPCLPCTAATLMRALDDADVPVSKVAQIVGHDVAISAKVMQLANSAFFGRSQEVTTIPHAVSVLGVDVLKQLLIAAEVFRAFQPRSRIEGFVLDTIQGHSLQVAAVAALLPVQKALVPAATIAGLLHDAGKLVMASRLPLECERIRRHTTGGRMSFRAAEAEVLGTSHAEIGAYLLSLWGLPTQVVSAVARHHMPGMEEVDQANFGASAAVYFANLLVHERESRRVGPASADLSEADQQYLSALGCGNEIDAWRVLAAEAHAA